MAGQKPELKISIKAPDRDAPRIDLFAYWRNERGFLSGKLDRKIRGMRVFFEDGSHVDVKRTPDGKQTHFINAYEDGGERRSEPRNNAPIDDGPGDDGWGDDGDQIPFMRVDERLV